MSCNDFTRLAPGIFYFPEFLSLADADDALADVREQVRFVQRSRTLYGRRVATPRQEAWFGPSPYTFGGSALPAAKLPSIVKSLALRAEFMISGDRSQTDARFDSCLANLYRDGRDSVGWHADDEPEMGDPIVAGVSLGAPRDFLLRLTPAARRTNRAVRLAGAPYACADSMKITLAHGSMLVMLRGVQREWQHCIPKRPACLDSRISLTFRDTRRV